MSGFMSSLDDLLDDEHDFPSGPPQQNRGKAPNYPRGGGERGGGERGGYGRPWSGAGGSQHNRSYGWRGGGTGDYKYTQQQPGGFRGRGSAHRGAASSGRDDFTAPRGGSAYGGGASSEYGSRQQYRASEGDRGSGSWRESPSGTVEAESTMATTSGDYLSSSRTPPSAEIRRPKPIGAAPRPASAAASVAMPPTPILSPPPPQHSAAPSTPAGAQSSSSSQSISDAPPASTASAATGESGGGAWRSKRFLRESQHEQRRRQVKSLVNKLTVEKFSSVAEKIAANIDEVTNESELSALVALVLEAAVNEPSFSEMFSDTLLLLLFRCPLFTSDGSSLPSSTLSPPQVSSPDGETESAAMTLSVSTPEINRKPVWSTVVVTAVQNEYEKTMGQLKSLELNWNEHPAEERESIFCKNKIRVLGICKLVAELFVRGLIRGSAVQRLIQELVNPPTTSEPPTSGTYNPALYACAPGAPPEYNIESVCQFFNAAGSFLNEKPATARFVVQVFARLHEIQKLPGCPARTYCIIQDLFDARKANWHQKVHKEKAKGLAQIKEEALIAEAVGGHHVVAQSGRVIKLGERVNLKNDDYRQYLLRQAELFRQQLGK